MASRISQMRNGLPQQMPAQQPQDQLSESIRNTRMLMNQMSSMGNKEAMIMQLLQNNPQLQSIIPMLRNGNNLEGIANAIAQSKGYDINEVIAGLQP